jgi:hypothetical protein
MPLILGANSITGGYEVDNSLRFDEDSSDYLSRTVGAGNRQTWTWSGWIKRGNIGLTTDILFGTYVSATDEFRAYFQDTDAYSVRFYNGNEYIIATNRLFRDTSAWYHMVIVADTTNATSGDRLRLYVNGERETSLSSNTQPPQNTNMTINNSNTLEIGSFDTASFFDGYMAEVVFIDGQALDPTSFGEFDEDTGIWKPISISGLTFGTNGFYLEFKDSSALGDDTSGNSNDFTVNNLTSVDQSTDTCTNNFCTMNPLSAGVGDVNRIPTFAEGNLKFTAASATFAQAISTFGVDKGKWYYEVKVVSSTHLDKLRVGLWNIDKNVSSGEIQDVSDANSGVFFVNKDGGEMRLNATDTTADYGTFAQNDIMGVANNIDDGTISIYKNGSVIVNAYDYSGGIASGIVLTPAFMGHTDTSFEINFGSPPYTISSGNSDANGYGNFEYSVPSGYYALNTKNLAEYG